MGFLAPNTADIDVRQWRTRPYHQRIRPLAQHWAMHGFGTPGVVHLLYLVKITAYALGGIAVVSATPGVGGIADFGSWWTEPIVYQKLVVWTLLYEVLGLGCGSGPLSSHFLPPVGAFLHWLRPSTVRLPPWPGRIPFTSGTRRTAADVALYAAVLGAAVWLLFTPGDTEAGGVLAPWRVAVLAALLALLGLRDKTVFLAARAEHYGLTLLVFLFPVADQTAALKLVMLALWWGAASSKLNRHFPFVVAVMISNSPLRPAWFKRRLYRNYPDDLRPSALASAAAHGGTLIEYVVPLVLVLSDGGPVTTIALTVMVVFHLHIMSTFPMGVPLEWNVFFIYSALVLFGHDAAVGAFALHSPLLAAVLALSLVVVPALGHVRPDLVSFLPSMRYYAGNWATSLWCFRKGTEHRLNEHIVKASALPVDQLTRLYGPEAAELVLHQGLAWRAMHSHGRALVGLLPRAVDDVESYDVREGEMVAGAVLGWNFGDGHLHDEQLLAAVQQRCGFAPGDLRVVLLESQPTHRQRQHYRIVDAATGQIEEGYVDVREMVVRQPWLDDETPAIPVEPVGPSRPATEVAAAHE
ncbi:DUF3556 domain-containing protein [Streptomyces sp. AS02]|uniref:DUF3556 domain-containing protein n=1 Tax=Streptomyces sp. AS02 TaxID=2938946 RepID=UPI00202081DC|nr:DUF3556 domain-containing protein [Streptomyces sp. AS02]MCL8012163.1 DUF3556 domain-containing protein [Streptomyces sp. AS02]